MKSKIVAALLSLTAATPAMIPSPAAAQRSEHRDDRHSQHNRSDHVQGRFGQSDDRIAGRWQGDRNDRSWDPANSYKGGNYRERRLGRNDRVYRGKDGRTYCKRNDGSTGLVIGAVGGGVLANLIGGGTLGTLAGAGGGALLGRSVDRGGVRCR